MEQNSRLYTNCQRSRTPLTADLLNAQDPALFKKIPAPCLLSACSHGGLPHRQIRFKTKDTTHRPGRHHQNQAASRRYFPLTLDMRNKPIHVLASSGIRAGSSDEIYMKREEMVVLENIHSRSADNFERLRKEKSQSKWQANCTDAEFFSNSRRNMKRRATIDSKI